MHTYSLYTTPVELVATSVEMPADIKAESITDFVIDEQGIVWIGTSAGVFSLDGEKARFFANKTANHVTALRQASDNAIWAGYKDGSLARFGKKTQYFSNPSPDSLTHPVSDIAFDHTGRLWWSTYGGGIYCRVNDRNMNLNSQNGLSDDFIYALVVGDDGKIWAASDKGISICEVDMQARPVITHNYTQQLPDLIVRAMQKDNSGNIWLGFHQGGLGRFDPENAEFHKTNPPTSLKFGKINAIELNDDRLWVATENGLFLKVLKNDQDVQSVLFDKGNRSPHIRAIATDPSGYLWVLTKKGLFATNGGSISVNQHPADEDVPHAILTMGQDKFWTATHSALIFHHNNKTKKYLNNILKPTTRFTTLAAGPNGQLWAGTLGEGIFILNPGDGSYRNITESGGLINNNVLSLAADHNQVWAGTLGGASQIIAESNRKFQINSFDKEHGLGNNFIYTVFADNNGSVWFGTDGNGLVRYKEGFFNTYDENSGLRDDVVYSVIDDGEGTLWFSTSEPAVYSFNGSLFTRYDAGNGLEGETVFSMAAMGEAVFVLTEEGLNIFNASKKHFICLNEELGLNQIQSDLNSVSSDAESIRFATHQQYITINKKLFPKQIPEPRASINRITVNLEPVAPDSGLSFSYSENRFVFEYAGSWPMAPNKLQYKVKLDGYDPEWKNTYDRSAVYPNLPPGDYTFWVKAFLGGAQQTGSDSSFGFTIRKPFYFSTGFIVAAAFLVFAAVFWFIRLRENQLKKTEARKKEQLEFEFQTLKNQVNPHFLFNSFSTLISIIEDNPEEAVEYTEALSEFFRNILEVKEQLLIPMTEELRILGHYTLIHQKRLGGNFEVTIRLDELAKKTKIPPLTLQLLAENALKHNVVAKDKPLSVTIRNDEKNIVVENNKRLKKIPEASTGIGLKNIRERYKLISGTEIEVEETPDFFRVRLPLIKKQGR